jgi:hypothetical protein
MVMQVRSLLFVVLLLASVRVRAGELGADAGLNYFGGGFGTGFGVNVYPGYRLDGGVILEAQLGLHTLNDAFARLVVVPVYAGGRFDLSDVVRIPNLMPFVGAHLGLLVSYLSIAGGGSASGTDLIINFGAGADVAIHQHFAIGGVVWYDLAPANTNNGWLTLGLNARYNFS